MVHVDVKAPDRIGSVPGHRITVDRRSHNRIVTSGSSCDFVQVCIDDRSRLSHTVIMSDETSASCIAAFEQSSAWFASNGIRIDRVMTDNGAPYKKRCREALQALGMQAATHASTPHRSTAKPNASSARYYANGHTPLPTTAMPRDARHCQATSTNTTRASIIRAAKAPPRNE